MPKYLFEGTYLPEAVKGVMKEGGRARRQAVEQLTQSLGGRLEAFYFTFGSRDYLVIADLPDSTAAAAVSAAVAASGASHPSTTPLITPEEFDQATKRPATYRAPGQ